MSQGAESLDGQAGRRQICAYSTAFCFRIRRHVGFAALALEIVVLPKWCSETLTPKAVVFIGATTLIVM
jgi:hypothetical protein